MCLDPAKQAGPQHEAKAQRELLELWSRAPARFTPKPFLRKASRLKFNSEPTVSYVCSAFPTE